MCYAFLWGYLGLYLSSLSWSGLSAGHQAGKLESVQSPPSLFSYLYSETTIEYN